MRKRFVISVITMAVIGVATYMLSQPKRGTVEWHLRELRHIDGIVDQWIGRYGSRGMADMNRRQQIKEWQSHTDALIKLGFLERRLFTVTNNRPQEIARALWNARAQHPDVNWEFGGPEYDDTTTNELAVMAPPNEMPRWETLIRKADAPLK